MTHQPTKNEIWEIEFDKLSQRNLEPSGEYTTELKTFIRQAIHQAKAEEWSKGWFNGIETGMRYFDTTGVMGTKLPNSNITMKQKLDELHQSSESHQKETP